MAEVSKNKNNSQVGGLVELLDLYYYRNYERSLNE